MTRTLSNHLKISVLVALAWSTTACISASAPKTEAGLIGEAMYSPQPWANSKPVNITARVNTIQSALSAVQSVSDTYAQFQRDVADARYQREARSAAYESHLYFQRLREEEARLAAIRQNDQRIGQVRIGTPQAIRAGPLPEWDRTGWDLGVAVAGWVGMQDAQLRSLRVQINTDMVRQPPPPPPPNRRGKKQ